MIQKALSFSLLICLLLTGTACEKNVAGPAGEPGKDGGNGNSNLYYSTVITLRSTTWESVEFGDETRWHNKIYLPEINSLVLKNGDVKVYALSGADWFPLPYYEGILVTQAKCSVGLVDIYHSNLHGGTPERPTERNYRVVVVSPK